MERGEVADVDARTVDWVNQAHLVTPVIEPDQVTSTEGESDRL